MATPIIITAGWDPFDLSSSIYVSLLDPPSFGHWMASPSQQLAIWCAPHGTQNWSSVVISGGSNGWWIETPGGPNGTDVTATTVHANGPMDPNGSKSNTVFVPNI